MAATVVAPLAPECPRCRSRHAVLARTWVDRKSYLCPDCEHVWDTEIVPLRTQPGAST